jgi:drug/metabolite transporter (DMT)-like permease
MHFTNVAGVMLALGSAVLWSFFWIFNVRDRRDATLKLFLNFALSLPFIAAATMIFSSPFPPDNRGLLGAAYIGVFEMGLTFVLWLYALKYAKTTAHVSVLVYIVPFLSLIVIHFVLREEILFSTVAGLLLIVAGILIQQAGSLRGKNAKNADAAKRTKRAEKPKRPTS